MNKRVLGNLGEEIASSFLQKRGYKILERNFKTRLGEIDIIAKDKNTLVFIEVKARTSQKFGLPFEAVNYIKQNKIKKMALTYLGKFKLNFKNMRFDVVSVTFNKENRPEINLICGAF